MRWTIATIFALTIASPTVTVAGQRPPGSITGNPTPGVEQPRPPVLADRITLTGCLARVGVPPADPNSYSESRFVLNSPKKVDKGPSGAGISAAATAPSALRYRLAAIDTFLAPFVGNRVEVSGEVINPTTGTGRTLRVEFIQKVAAKCP